MVMEYSDSSIGDYKRVGNPTSAGLCNVAHAARPKTSGCIASSMQY